MTLSWGAGFYSHHPWVLKPMAWMKIFQGITLNAKRCSHGLPNMLGCFMDFLVGLIGEAWKSWNLSCPLFAFFSSAPTQPFHTLSPRKQKTQQNIQNLKWDVRDVRSVDFPSFCHILEVTLHLNPWKGHLAIPKRSQRIAQVHEVRVQIFVVGLMLHGSIFLEIWIHSKSPRPRTQPIQRHAMWSGIMQWQTAFVKRPKIKGITEVVSRLILSGATFLLQGG